MDLPYSLLCLAHGSHKVHNRKYCEEWLGLGQRPGGTLVYYQEGLLQVKKICQRLIIKVRKHKNAGILLCLATSVRLMGIRLYSWNSANRTNIPARDSISYPKHQLPFANFFFPYIVTTRILQRVGHVKRYSPHQSEDQTCHPEFLHQSRLGFPGQAAFPFFETLETVGEEPS